MMMMIIMMMTIIEEYFQTYFLINLILFIYIFIVQKNQQALCTVL